MSVGGDEGVKVRQSVANIATDLDVWQFHPPGAAPCNKGLWRGIEVRARLFRIQQSFQNFLQVAPRCGMDMSFLLCAAWLNYAMAQCGIAPKQRYGGAIYCG